MIPDHSQLLRAEGAYAKENPFRFSTQFVDDETGLVYHNARYYSPNLGRFINRDPIEEAGGLNLYGYVSNDSANKWDILGAIGAADYYFTNGNGQTYFDYGGYLYGGHYVPPNPNTISGIEGGFDGSSLFNSIAVNQLIGLNNAGVALVAQQTQATAGPVEPNASDEAGVPQGTVTFGPLLVVGTDVSLPTGNSAQTSVVGAALQSLVGSPLLNTQSPSLALAITPGPSATAGATESTVTTNAATPQSPAATELTAPKSPSGTAAATADSGSTQAAPSTTTVPRTAAPDTALDSAPNSAAVVMDPVTVTANRVQNSSGGVLSTVGSFLGGVVKGAIGGFVGGVVIGAIAAVSAPVAIAVGGAALIYGAYKWADGGFKVSADGLGQVVGGLLTGGLGARVGNFVATTALDGAIVQVGWKGGEITLTNPNKAPTSPGGGITPDIRINPTGTWSGGPDTLPHYHSRGTVVPGGDGKIGSHRPWQGGP